VEAIVIDCASDGGDGCCDGCRDGGGDSCCDGYADGGGGGGRRPIIGLNESWMLVAESVARLLLLMAL